MGVDKEGMFCSEGGDREKTRKVQIHSPKSDMYYDRDIRQKEEDYIGTGAGYMSVKLRSAKIVSNKGQYRK